jgi:rhomboid protease GluP
MSGMADCPGYYPAVYGEAEETEPATTQPEPPQPEEPHTPSPQSGSDFGFTAIVIWGCISIYIATLLFDVKGIKGSIPWNILPPSLPSLVVFGASGSVPVFQLGRWWTVLSAGWLHGNILHIAFNLLWVKELAPPVGRVFGAGRLVVIYTLSTATGALLSSAIGKFLPNSFQLFRGAEITVGASGAIFGLLGALVSYGQLTGNDTLKKQMLSYVIAMFIFGLLMPSVDNWGHLGGFLGGYLVTQLPGIRPQSPEGIPQRVAAIVCLILIVFSVAASILDGLHLLSAS